MAKLAVIFAMLLWLVIASILIIFGSRMPAVFGQVGDSFGMLNSFFSALAFSGVLYSLWQQNVMMKKQEKEIDSNKTAADKQISILSLQLSETTFFTALNGIDSIVSSLNQMKKDPTKDTYFESIYAKIHGVYRTEFDFPNLHLLRKFFYDNEWQFGYYFRFVKMILQLIDGSDAPEERKHLYVRILQARMSNDELRTFLYFVISDLSDPDEYPGTITYSEKIDLQRLLRKYDFFAVVRTRLAINLINPDYDWEILRRLVYEPFDKFTTDGIK